MRKTVAVSVPEVIANEEAFLLLEWIEEENDTNDSSMEKLGFQFAELHRFHGEKFGFMQENFLGYSPQINIPSSTGSEKWATFFVENRLKYQAELADKNGYSTQEMLILLDLLIMKIPDLLSGTEEKPSLLHGDLCYGNYLIDVSGKPWLIDPAVY